MPFFRVLLNGEGIRILATAANAGTLKLPPSEHDIIGFYTTRYVYALDEGRAADRAIAMVEKLWARPPYSGLEGENRPTLTAEEVNRVGIIAGLFGKPRKGHTFYGFEPEEEDAV